MVRQNGNTFLKPNGPKGRIQPTNEVLQPGLSAPAKGDGSDSFQVMCGPLLNYQGMTEEAEGVYWHGSVLIVVEATEQQPKLQLDRAGAIPQHDGPAMSKNGSKDIVHGLKLYSDPDKTFWRFTMRLPLTETETKWQYTIDHMHFISEVSTSPTREFVVPALDQSMRLMFHSCNGFSVGTDLDHWTGPVLWQNVLDIHKQRPFHCMLGGGDQIYNDGVRVNGPLKRWTAIGNPKKRRDHLFDEGLRAECDQYYFDNYVRWFSTEPFAAANASIPQVNIWDDHDIIDGFGSYTDHFMRCAVFRGIGGVSFKYYCLFQHHTAPPQSTFTTDAPSTTHANADGTAGADPRQLKDTYVYKRTADDPSWIVGRKPGPYVEERSRSLYLRLGKRMALCGIDARTERTRRQVNYPETYDLIFERLQRELTAANGHIRHLILLLGIPIAYPRLDWLENFLRSPLIAPIRLLNKRFGVAGSFFNQFDGGVDLLDDLDDHYTSRAHKHERKELILRLQSFAQQFGVRVTILGGDVHLGAMGRFYSAPKLSIPAEQDHRYMANIVSSAITNKPPPAAVANLLARRNKIHHLKDDATDETLLAIFDKQPGGVMKSAEYNKCTMPSRNFATITEVGADGVGAVQAVNGINGEKAEHQANKEKSYAGRDGHQALHWGEEGAGSKHLAADGVSTRSGMVGGLDIALRVEIDPKNREGTTEGYGFSVPPLEMKGKA